MRPSQNSAKRRMISMTTKTAKSNNHAPAPVKEHMAAKDHAAAKDHTKDRTKKSDAGPKNESEVLLANTLGQIEKTFGKGSIMKLTEATSPSIRGISSGALSL